MTLTMLGAADVATREKEDFACRAPRAEDGEKVWSLVASCPPLDRNSLYCNLLQCTHFSDTCVLAEKGGRALGWVSAYRPPAEPETLFIWQVAVHDDARGAGLARLMIEQLLARPSARGVTRLRTTITPDNEASWALFKSVAKALDAPFSSAEWLEKEAHFGDRHEPEHLVTIGPFETRPPAHRL
ncbi:MAG: diaminobutyrate acetyltransferase [Parvularculaceae bacterium]